MDRFDVVVIGAGMIGAAAARHLAEAHHSVAIVGPSEPDDWSTGPGPFASHYDAGRITRLSAKDAVWSELAARSIRRYGELEERTGITFHEPCGLAWVGFELADAITNANDRGGSARAVSASWLAETTGIVAPADDGMECMYEEAPAGLVNPRRLVAAELRAADIAGAVRIGHAARSIKPTPGGVDVMSAGGTVSAERVLLATGAYGADMIGVDLRLERRLRTTVRADLGPRRAIPNLIADHVSAAELDGIYWVPPVEYPDGQTLLKIGGDYAPAEVAARNDEIDAWFASDGSAGEAAALRATIDELLPNVPVRSWDAKPCVVTLAPTGYPYIGWIDDGVAIAVAGNGAAAKSCDEIGRLASTMFSAGGWSDVDLPLDTFVPLTR